MNRRALLLASLLLGAHALVAPAARAAMPAAPLTVLAASSLTESLQAVAAGWRAQGNGAVTLSFDASSRLARQIEGGIPADAFFSADQAWMDALEGKGLVGPRVVVAGNALVVVVRTDAAFVPADAGELADPRVGRLALAGENVPAGRYARAALGALDRRRVVSGDNVRSVLAWVARGDADAGVVYATDARVEPRVKVAFSLPGPDITYPAAALTRSPRRADAERFLAYCKSAEAQAIFAVAGFSPGPG